MSKEKAKESIMRHKTNAIAKLDQFMNDWIDSDEKPLGKKADILSYWIENYVGYLQQEPTFQPTKLMNYSRGNVIRVNFGFRVGSEMGGLHYAVVVDDANSHSAGVLTVVPLSSTDGKRVHPSNVDLGAELYSKVSAHHAAVAKKLSSELEEVVRLLSTLDLFKEMKDPDERAEAMAKVLMTSESLEEKRKTLVNLLASNQRYSSEISRMKSGSMAVINQITTISKQRIYTPRKSADFLYGISLSDAAMEKINKKLIEKLSR